MLVTVGAGIDVAPCLEQLSSHLAHRPDLLFEGADLRCEQRLKRGLDVGARAGVRKIQQLTDFWQFETEPFGRSDELQALEMLLAEVPIPVGVSVRGEHPESLVVAQRARRNPGPLGNLRDPHVIEPTVHYFDLQPGCKV